MRRLSAIVVLSAALQGVAAAPADAWWEIIEQFSGPGPFKGWALEARFLCLVDPDGAGPSPAEARWVSAAEMAAGVCKLKPGEVRRASIDAELRLLADDNDARFASGQKINLTTFAPSITWNILSNPRWDVVDYGMAAGVYWFTSTQFTGFHGAFFEPMRLEFHAPSNLREEWWGLLVPRFRFSVLVSPSGFDTVDFAASPGVPARIPRDWVRNYAVFIDLQPLVSRIP